jgi:hypothetical protein
MDCDALNLVWHWTVVAFLFGAVSAMVGPSSLSPESFFHALALHHSMTCIDKHGWCGKRVQRGSEIS